MKACSSHHCMLTQGEMDAFPVVPSSIFAVVRIRKRNVFQQYSRKGAKVEVVTVVGGLLFVRYPHCYGQARLM